MAWRALPSLDCNSVGGFQLSQQGCLSLCHPSQAGHYVMPQIPGKALLQGFREAADCLSR